MSQQLDPGSKPSKHRCTTPLVTSTEDADVAARKDVCTQTWGQLANCWLEPAQLHLISTSSYLRQRFKPRPSTPKHHPLCSGSWSSQLTQHSRKSSHDLVLGQCFATLGSCSNTAARALVAPEPPRSSGWCSQARQLSYASWTCCPAAKAQWESHYTSLAEGKKRWLINHCPPEPLTGAASSWCGSTLLRGSPAQASAA